MTRLPLHLESVLELAIAAGALSIRGARMEPGRRYKIDVRDEAHPIVYVNADLPREELGPVAIDAAAVLDRYWQARRRRPIAPVAELVGDESLLEAATGTEGVSDLAARQRRRTFGVVSDLES